MGDNMPEDHQNAVLVRDAMERTVAELPTVHDLVPTAVAQGRRRRLRARLGTATVVACVAGAVVFGVGALPLGGGGETTIRPAATGTPAPSESLAPSPVPEPKPYRTPVHIEPTSSDEPSMANLPAAERERREQFQQRAALLLDELLPDAVGLIRPIDLNVNHYQGETKDGKAFRIIFSVRPSGGGSPLKSCPEKTAVVKDCERATLPGGRQAIAFSFLSDSPGTTATLVQFSYGNSDVSLTVNPDPAAKATAPVTSKQLLTAAGDPRFLDLVQYADKNPMQERQISIPGG
ncbi:hypothetical protein [Streptomyces sp. NPDC051211]|uniref:hypothetical protein n=1 Tax=Streptomyces sp. NPDC051211 TaxID=3154643 RepID=UPI00344BE268